MRMVKVQECDLAQGFLFSRPLPVDDLTAILVAGEPLPQPARR
jgi:EAL domain-containing protein (putative c-di-GMP-specific phosphodiesterase class I)